MPRFLAALFLAGLAHAQVSDPIFTRVPFDQWTEAGQAHLRWKTQIEPVGLGNHQRLLYRIDVRIDGAELVKRRGKGALLDLVEVQDSSGRIFQSHGSMNLEGIKDDVGGSDLQYIQDVFLLPGEYRVKIAAYVSSTDEYAIVRRTLRVEPTPHDPLPDAWRDLPTVEFLPNQDVPDAWFLPTIRGKLNLPIETHRRVEIELLVNASPSEEVSVRRPDRTNLPILSVLIPSMKTLAQLTPQNGSMSVSMFDLARQKIMLQSTGALSWDQLRGALAETSQPSIDVHALEKRQGNAQFFLKEVARRVENAHGADALHVLIVLSAPMAFADGEDLHPIQTSAGRNCKVFYIRYYPVVTRFVVGPQAPVMGRRGAQPGVMRAGGAPPSDSLERTLKPLDPRLFDVNTPLEFRKSMATVIEEIEHAAR